MKVVAGVDTHKRTHSIVVLDAIGSQLLAFTISADYDGYEQAIARTAQLGDVVWGIEGTGVYGRLFAETLNRRGALVYEVPGAVTRRYRKRDRGKSDPIDARAIAEAVLREADKLPKYERVDEQDAIRLMYDRRDRLVRERTVAINRLRADALRLGWTDLPNDLSRVRSLKRMQALIGDYSPTTYTEGALVDEIREAILDIERCNARVKEIERKLRPFVDRIAPKVLDLHGVSLVIAAGIIGHAGNIRNCRDASAFAMRAGVAPIPCWSGQYPKVRVNPGGNRQLNRCLHVMALVQMCTKDHPGRQYYERKREEGKTHRSALRALKRHLATVTFYRLREGLSAASAPIIEVVAA